MAEIEYFFTHVSPWTYLGHRAFLDLVAAHGAKVVYRPVMLGKVFANSGAQPLAERPKARQDYRLVELQRWRDRRGLPLNLKPKHFPTNPGLADRAAIALIAAGRDPGDFSEAVMAACWAEEKDIADPAVVREKLSAAGHDADRVLAEADEDAAKAEHEKNTADAIALNAIGAPTYVLNGETFWGQDRLDLLGDALSSRRAPFAA
jgi:2-hydroxychromene-2-carboxylate isomerase